MSPRVPQRFASSKLRTGSSSRIAVLIRPFASAGVLATMILRPGTPVNMP
jgi:hypothetical protein